jgi:deoxyribose-phosphate aldolase
MQEIKDIAIKLFGPNKPCTCGGEHEICLNCHYCRTEHEDMLWDETKPIAQYLDATVLKADAKEADIRALCEHAYATGCKAVCINSHYLPLAATITKEKVGLCTVINFPLGSNSNDAVLAEAEAVLAEEIEELDMVQNLSAMLSGYWQVSYQGIHEVRKACDDYDTWLKVIIETCFLSREQLIISCLIAKKAGADFVKTSTGMGSGGATVENIKLMRDIVGPKLGVKASGGVRTREEALAMLKAGASRIGTSNAKGIIEG